jgi:hypothetical protein
VTVESSATALKPMAQYIVARIAQKKVARRPWWIVPDRVNENAVIRGDCRGKAVE